MTQPAIFAGPRSDEWRTPAWLREKIVSQYRPTVDLAACERSSLAPLFYCKDDSLFSCVGWDGLAWMNPPFSKANDFFAHVAPIAENQSAQVVAIYKANLETATWQAIILPSCTWVFAPARRVAYEPPPGVLESSPQFASLLVGWNVPPPVGIAGALLVVRSINPSNR